MKDIAFNQKRCDKHEMVVVTQTTTTTGIERPTKKIQWLQCKNCSHTIPLSNQIPEPIKNKAKWNS